MTTPTDLTIESAAPVEAAIGPRTSAWLVSMGWTPPSDPAPAASDIVQAEQQVPAPTLEQAVAENEERAQRLLVAQTHYSAIKSASEVGFPGALDALLQYFGVNLTVFMPPPPPVPDPAPAAPEPTVVEPDAPPVP